ncbi:response regulator [Candidatus Beckwithbacteria bacterium]|nr:response regulator [Candidatus Beckwithbacteria bacterium]
MQNVSAIKILIADDDPQFSDILHLLLQKEGYQVDIANNEKSVLEAISQKNYNLILQDVFFPSKEQGLSMLQKLYESIALDNTAIILMTSMPTKLFKEEIDLDKYLQIAKQFISKTEDNNVIIASIKQVLAEQN